MAVSQLAKMPSPNRPFGYAFESRQSDVDFGQTHFGNRPVAEFLWRPTQGPELDFRFGQQWPFTVVCLEEAAPAQTAPIGLLA